MLLELAGFSWNQLGIGYPRTMPSEGPQELRGPTSAAFDQQADRGL